mmetsp:Transcript_9196/g.19935  ORF Transcript_9196/g.19935 Transcript_9196/m.19935 type:complete len:597 (+) Transcript_9196:91-1881(+)
METKIHIRKMGRGSDIEEASNLASHQQRERGKHQYRWQNVSYSIGEKVILNSLSGSIKSGDFYALVGPSGSGKTSLLNILSGRTSTSGKKLVTGKFNLNGLDVQPRAIRRTVAYVLQDDIMFPTATVREALEFSAKLRLSSSTTKAERDNLVEQLLDSLGLKSVEDTIIGSELIRGLSGGERKRCAIGVELVTNPGMIFLDEPTSGLDSFSAFKVVDILQQLTRKTNCTIVCTIHQPSSPIFSMFTHVCALAAGTVVYNGPVNMVPSKLEEMGFSIPVHSNPADHLLLLAQTEALSGFPSYNHDDELCTDLRSPIIVQELGSLEEQAMASFVSQAWELAKREFKRISRNRAATIATYSVICVLHFVFGVIFMHAGDRLHPGYTVNAEFGALTMVFVSAMFASSQGPLVTLPLEKEIFMREYNVAYGAVPYLLSKLIIELPDYFFRALLSLLITYFLIGFNGDFFEMLVELWILMLATTSYSYCLGAAAKDALQCQQFAPLVIVPQLLFTGFFISISQIPQWLQWVQYICSLKYAVNLAMISEFGDCELEACTGVLSENDVKSTMIWVYILVLVCIFAIFRVFSLAILAFRARRFSY